MASDTATLDLERVHEERQRLEAERDGDTGQRAGPLGPDDQAPADEPHVDTDPATRAAQIVQEVLAAAEQRRGATTDRDPAPEPADGTAAARARRIVEEVLATATDASDAQHVTAGDVDEDPAPSIVRADLVLLTASEPLVLLPGHAYDPEDGAYVPGTIARPLPSLVDRVLSSVALDAPREAAEADELTTPTSITEAIRGAGESSNRHGVRWVVAGAVWALAFALAGPLAYKTLISSADMTIELWDQDNTVVEQQVEVPEEEIPEESAPGEPQPAEAELDG